jgi:hypothetical protein
MCILRVPLGSLFGDFLNIGTFVDPVTIFYELVIFWRFVGSMLLFVWVSR